MKLLAIVAAALMLCGTAGAYTTPPGLSQVASRIAGQPVEARCYEAGEDGAPGSLGAWGYVVGDIPIVHLDPTVCEGAAAVADPATTVPLWKQGLGVLVLTHEAFHLATRYRDRGDEAKTECRAVRHARYANAFLGGDARWENVKVAVLAMHYLLVNIAPRYALAGCKVPGWWDS